jgi:hypothetical protein
MAYLYRKKRSPFWYVQYLDSDRKKHDKSTGLRADDPNVWAKRSHDHLGAIPRDRRNRQEEPNGQLQYTTGVELPSAAYFLRGGQGLIC